MIQKKPEVMRVTQGKDKNSFCASFMAALVLCTHSCVRAMWCAQRK